MDVSSLLGQLKNLSATIDGANKGCWKATFLMPDGADYTIVAYIYADGGADISPKRYGSPDEEYFCSIPFEQADFSTVQELQ